MTPARKPNLPGAIRQLRHAIARLTEPTAGYENSRYIEAPGLYRQLQLAVYGQQSNTGGGGGAKSRPPFWTDAVDQLHNIDLMVNLWPTGSAGSTVTQLRSLAVQPWTVEETRSVRRLAGIVDVWADDIHRRDSAGELVREPALKIAVDGCGWAVFQRAPDFDYDHRQHPSGLVHTLRSAIFEDLQQAQNALAYCQSKDRTSEFMACQVRRI